jgi:lysophospholipase L1-like esterase
LSRGTGAGGLTPVFERTRRPAVAQVPTTTAVAAVGALALALAACSSGAADGVPLDDLASTANPPVTVAPSMQAAVSEGEVAAPDDVPAPVLETVEEVLGGQASIARPVGDDGSGPLVEDNRVFVLGDSIAESAGPEIYDTIDAQLKALGWRPTIDARAGRTTPQGLEVLERRRDDVHDVVIVLLGHNDAVDPAAYRDRLETMVAELDGVPLVLLLTNYEFERGRDRMNDELRLVDALHDNVQLVDWDAVAKATDGAIGPDGLHLTRLGAQALAATMAMSLGPAPPETAGP